MPRLEDLTHRRDSDLKGLCDTYDVERGSDMLRDDKIVALAEPPLSEEGEKILRSNTGELKRRAKEQNVERFSKMRKHQLINRLVALEEGRESAQGSKGASAPDRPRNDDAEERRRVMRSVQACANKKDRAYHVFENTDPSEVDNLYYYWPAKWYGTEREGALYIKTIEPETG